MSRKYLLDTTVFGDLKDMDIDPELLSRSPYKFAITQIQENEINNTTDPSFKRELIKSLQRVKDLREFLFTGRLGTQKLGKGKLGGDRNKRKYKEMDVGKIITEDIPSEDRNERLDILTAETAIQRGYTLVTNDQDLYDAVNDNFPGSVIKVKELIQKIKNLPSNPEVGIAPADWEIKSLSTLSDVTMGSSPESTHYNEEQKGLPFHQGNNEFGFRFPSKEVWCSEPIKIAEVGSILISVRAPVGDVNIARNPCCIGRGLSAISPNNINREFLFQHLQERRKWLSRISAGSTYDSINSSQLKSLKIRVPPLPEQRKIASILYNVDQAIQKTEEIIEQTKRVKKGVQRDIFEFGLDDNFGFRGHPELKETYLGRLPSDWTLCPLEEVCKEVVDCPHSTPDYQDSTEDGILVARTSEIEGGKFKQSSAPQVNYDQYNKRISRLEPKAGDIIFTREAPIGEAFKIPEDKRICLGQRVMILRADSNNLSSDYLLELIYSDIMQKWFKRSSRGSTSTHLNVEDVKNLRVPVPPIKEQRRIENVLKEYRKKIRLEEESRNKLKALKKGLMQDLLTGDVRTRDNNIEVIDEVKSV